MAGYIIVSLAAMALAAFIAVLGFKERRELHDRLAAKDLEEFKYFKTVHPIEAKHNEEVLALQRKKIEEDAKKHKTADEIEGEKKAEGF